MWKFSIICSFMAVFTGIALNLISNSIHDKRKQLSELEKRIEQKIEKLKIDPIFTFISKVIWSYSIPIDFGGCFLFTNDEIAFKKLSLFQSV